MHGFQQAIVSPVEMLLFKCRFSQKLALSYPKNAIWNEYNHFTNFQYFPRLFFQNWPIQSSITYKSVVYEQKKTRLDLNFPKLS